MNPYRKALPPSGPISPQKKPARAWGLTARGKRDYDADDYLAAFVAAEAAEAEPDAEAVRAERSRLENGLAEFAWNT